jgi:hypothetical protein
MEQLDISIWAIIKVILAGFFIYVIAPALLVLRDLLLHKVIEKWILTQSLNYDIYICESDRWFLNNKYAKNLKKRVSGSSGSIKYEIDEKEVSSEIYSEYESGLKMHQIRFHKLDSKINMRHNLILWLTKHYKQDKFTSPVPELRKEAYDRAEKRNA